MIRRLALAGLLAAAVALAGCTTTVTGQAHPGGHASTAQAPISGIVPVAITIPSLEVAADVTTVGLDPARKVAVPDVHHPELAAWVDAGPRVGAAGTAMVVGHINGGGTPGVFANLAEIKPGADVLLTDKTGASVRFVVEQVQQHAKTAFPAAEVFADTSQPQLVLVTCGGQLDTTAHSYEDNILVRARKA